MNVIQMLILFGIVKILYWMMIVEGCNEAARFIYYCWVLREETAISRRLDFKITNGKVGPMLTKFGHVSLRDNQQYGKYHIQCQLTADMSSIPIYSDSWQ